MTPSFRGKGLFEFPHAPTGFPVVEEVGLADPVDDGIFGSDRYAAPNPHLTQTPVSIQTTHRCGHLLPEAQKGAGEVWGALHLVLPTQRRWWKGLLNLFL